MFSTHCGWHLLYAKISLRLSVEMFSGEVLFHLQVLLLNMCYQYFPKIQIIAFLNQYISFDCCESVVTVCSSPDTFPVRSSLLEQSYFDYTQSSC